MDTLNAIHDKMLKAVNAVGGHIDAIFYCPHPADSDCDCRKPKPGLFRQIAERFNINLEKAPAIGDSLRDLEASASVGCLPMLVLTGKGRQTEAEGCIPENTLKFADLVAAVNHLLGAEA
jgi:D-glycero-D-manno-heptose 1,7-bisphosphate phosphatase